MQSQLIPARFVAMKRWKVYHPLYQEIQQKQQRRALHQQQLIISSDNSTKDVRFSPALLPQHLPRCSSEIIEKFGERTYHTRSSRYDRNCLRREMKHDCVSDVGCRNNARLLKSYTSTSKSLSVANPSAALSTHVERTGENPISQESKSWVPPLASDKATIQNVGNSQIVEDQYERTSKQSIRRTRFRELSTLDLELGCTNEEEDDINSWEDELDQKSQLTTGRFSNNSLGKENPLDFLFLPSTRNFHPGLGVADADLYYDSDDDDSDDSDNNSTICEESIDSNIDDNNTQEMNNDDDRPHRNDMDSLMSPLDYISLFDPQNPPSGENREELQYWLECQSQHEAVERFQKVIDDARERKDYGSLSTVQRQILRWYPTLQEEIAKEQRSFITKEGSSKSRNRFGPYLCILPPSKLAIIVSHEAVMGTLLRGDSGGSTASSMGSRTSCQEGLSFTQLVTRIGQAVEEEVVIHRILHKRFKDAYRRLDKMKNKNSEQEAISLLIDDDNPDPLNLNSSPINEHEANKENTPYDDNLFLSAGTTKWASVPSNDNLLLSSGTTKWAYAASHLKNYLDEVSKVKQTSKKKRVIKYAIRRARQVLDRDVPWSVEDHIHLGAKLLQILLDTTTIEVPRDDTNGVGHTGEIVTEKAFNFEKRWKKKQKTQSYVTMNERLYNMVVNDKLQTFGITTTRYKPMIVPPKPWTTMKDGGYKILRSELLRFHGCNTQKDVLRLADLSTVFDGLNSLGRVTWKVNKQILHAAQTCWDRNIPLGDIPTRTDFVLPEQPVPLPYWEGKLDKDSEDFKMRIIEQKNYQEKVAKYNRIKQKNMDLRSLRCSAMLKLDQAEKFQNFDQIYFPYNMDFRGRAYPIPPHLSNVGSDLCRGILKFAEAKPLGERGFYWLKVHLANFAGKDKMKFDDRAKFVDDNIEQVRASVNDPFGEDRWWMSLEDPFQGLATCYEIIAAIDSGDPTSYMCSLPVHMDGSCNGLQHYAALGRDKVGGTAVNLCATTEPQDVYVGVMHEVIKRVAEEAERLVDFDTSDIKSLTSEQRQAYYDNQSAKLVNGLIDRGVVKRTVMTSVYGVTYIGARKQIQEKIESKVSWFDTCLQRSLCPF
jgi:DNA-dependent RNA polymerase/DNA-directed RNA polymerase N-terminal